MFNKIVSFLQTDITEIANLNKKDRHQEEIGETTITLHNQALSETKLMGAIVKNLDDTFFQSADFLYYLDIKSAFINNESKYKGLYDSAELFRLAVIAQRNFLKIEQTELRYRSRKQQEFYEYIFDLLVQKFEINPQEKQATEGIVLTQKHDKQQPEEKKCYSSEDFKKLVEQKLVEVKQDIKTEQGRSALDDYTKSLEELATEKNLGLKLLYLFKKSSNPDFSILRTISSMTTYLQDKDMRNMKAMEDLADKNKDIFFEVGRIIGVPKEKQNISNYAVLLQYIALSSKYLPFLEQFSKTISLLKSWEIPYQTVIEIRGRYREDRYALPKEFQAEIPAVEMYEKYHPYFDLFS